MNISAFDLNLLKVWHAMLRHRSTVGAGHAVGLSQPAVSAALKRLRDSLGDPLFVREGKGLVPTEFCLKAEPILNQAIGEIGELLHGPDGFDAANAVRSFRISGSDFFGDLMMPELVRKLRHEAPGVSIEMVDSVFANTLDAIERFKVDFVFWPVLDFPPWIDHLPIFAEPFVVVAPKGHPDLERAGIAEGEKIPIDLYCDMEHSHFLPEGMEVDDVAKGLQQLGRSRRLVATMPTFGGVYSMVVTAGLIAVLPKRFAELKRREGLITLHPLTVPFPPTQLCILWHRQFSYSAGHIWFRDAMYDILMKL